jgi:hypothetical protein
MKLNLYCSSDLYCSSVYRINITNHIIESSRTYKHYLDIRNLKSLLNDFIKINQLLKMLNFKLIYIHFNTNI